MSKYIAIKIDDTITVHAAGDAGGGYDSLCGIDANDPAIGHSEVDVPRGAKIDCDICKGHFLQWKSLRKSDFEI
jgi:hypothetical protein